MIQKRIQKLFLIAKLHRDRFQNCVISVRIRSYSGPHFPAFGLNTERYGVSLHIQSKCGKKRTRITRNTDTFDPVQILLVVLSELTSIPPGILRKPCFF